MNSKYWQKYNLNKKKVIKKIIEFNRKNKVNYFEDLHFNHTRDIFALGLALANKKSKKFEVLDYGSNPLALANLPNKIDLKKFNFTIFDPFLYNKTKKIYINKVKYKEIKIEKNILYNKYDFIHYGSSLQYQKDFLQKIKRVNLNNTEFILITYTPFSMGNSYNTKQTNHPNLEQNIYSFLSLKNILAKKNFKLIFKSRNDDKYKACKIEKFKTYSLNLLFKK